MKKIQKVTIIILIIIFTAVGGILFINFTQQSRLDDIFSGEKTDISADEILLDSKKVKAPKASELLTLTEKEITFDAENEKSLKAIEKIDSDFFSGVILKSDSLQGKTAKIDSGEREKLFAFAQLLREKGLKVYFSVSIDYSPEELASLCEGAEGVILCGGEGLNVEKLNSRLLKIRAAITLLSVKKESYVALPFDYDFTKLNKKSVSGVYFPLSSPKDGERLKTLDKAMKIAGVKLIAGFDFKADTPCDMPLRSFYEIHSCESVSARAYSGYEIIEKNEDNIFGALKQYIRGGIVPEMAFRELAVTGYNGEVQSTEEYEKEIEIYGSNLFPAYMNEKKIKLGENGSRKISLSYTEGENLFAFKQGSRAVEYKLNFTFKGEIIRSVSPAGEITASPKESVRVFVVAFSEANIKIKLGTKTFNAVPYDKNTLGYTVFSAKIKMPKTKEEIASLGMITVIGSCGERSEQMKGAMILPAEEESTSPVRPEETTKATTYALIGNYSPSLPEEAYTQQTLPEVQSSVTVPDVTVPYFTPYTGAQMCVVTSAYADTWRLIDGDDTFVPYYTPLVAGTVDYVVGESESYNEEEGEQMYFYDLASGRKVKRSDVQLVPETNLGSNSMNVLSSIGDGGTLKITMSTLWRVPYDINYTPQNYYSGYWKEYNVSSFTADKIQLTFYHTPSVSGSIDVTGSNVISSAQFSSAGGNTVLTLSLKQAGVYYGCSAEYDSAGNFVLTVHNKPQSLSGAFILLDPGHGGGEPGAVGIGGQVKEKDVNYAIAYYTKLALERRGAVVYMTRGGDSELTLEERKHIVRSVKPDLFIAIHNNGSEYSDRIGTSTYYFKPFSYPLAKNIYDNLLSVYKNNIYAGRSELYGDIADGTIFYPFSVTRLEDCPSVLLEVGYMTNDSECYELIKTENQQLFAEAIAKGVEQTLI